MPTSSQTASDKPKLSWMLEANKLNGVREVKGPVDNPAVVKMFADVGHAYVQDDETAWCAAFVGACLKRAGLPHTSALNAKSYEAYGKKLAAPAYGCIAVKNRKGGKSWQGHVGFVVAANAKTIWLLSGNAGDMVKIAPFVRSEFTAYRWPVGQPTLNTQLATTFKGAAGAVTES